MSFFGYARYRKLHLLLVGGVILLIMVNFAIHEMTIDIFPRAPKRGQSSSALQAAQGEREYTPLSLDLPETLARPVFSPTRRDVIIALPEQQVAVEAQAVDAAPKAITPPPMKLRGTRDVHGRRAALMITGEEADWCNEGDLVGGWKLVSVHADRVVLEAGADSITISLYETRIDGEDHAAN